jgi:hypothetical protein
MTGLSTLARVHYGEQSLIRLVDEIIDHGVKAITDTKFCKDEFDRYWKIVGNSLLNTVHRAMARRSDSLARFNKTRFKEALALFVLKTERSIR